MKKDKAAKIIESAVRKGRKTLTEYESKQILAAYDIPITKEILVKDKDQLEKGIAKIGFPQVLKSCSADIAHKTEKGLIHVDIRNATEAKKAYRSILEGMKGFDGAVLMQEMISGRRELVIGMTRDPQFGPCVMFGLGGIFTEILRDVVFRRAPLTERDTLEMMEEIKGRKILDAVRGMPAADTATLTQMLISIGQIGLDFDDIMEIDLNPVILAGSKPVVVDALMILKDKGV